MYKFILSAVSTALLMSANVATADDHGNTIETRWADLEIETVASGLVRPWGISFMPDGRMLVTELPRRIRIVEADGTLGEPLAGVPEITVRNQGGLFDVTLAPDFKTSQRIYISYSEPESPGSTVTSTAVAHARIVGHELQDFTRIFSGEPKVEGGRHDGGRMTFSDDGQYLFLGLGDRGHQMMQAQELDSHTGTIIRIHADGSIPADNPFVNNADAQNEIWSYGHRNVQGIDIQPSTGTMWSVEHGPQGGDEINHPMAGHNYGWPVITYGEEYGGGELAVSQGTHQEGLEQPIWHWTPSIAVSGMTFYEGDVFPQWQGNILAGALRGQQIARMEIEDGRVMHYEPIPMEYRIRQVAVGPQGFVYALTDERENAKIIRLKPKAD